MTVRRVLPPDAIPSIDDPTFGRRYVGDDGDEVVVVTADDEPARAYPLRILDFHEIVNDVVGVPVAVTWCPLCASAVVYDRRVQGEPLTFGVSGKLADDDLVMYDRETGSEWKQSLGRCLAGAYEGRSLDVLPATVTTWEAFRTTHDDGVVLQPPRTKSEAASDTDEPAPVDYTLEPYAEYHESEGFGLGAHRGTGGRTWHREDDIEPKTLVLGVEVDADGRVDGDGDGTPTVIGFPGPRVEAAGGVATADVGETAVVVFAVEDGLHGFENPGYEFRVSDGTPAADGTTWNPVTGESADGRRLDRLPTRRLFAFTWQDDHGPDAFWPQG